MSINIPSSLLIDALEFAKTHEITGPWFIARNNSPQMSAKSIKVEVYAINHNTKFIYIRIYVDYVELSPNVGQIEDLIINLAWHNGKFTLGRSGSVAGF